MSLELSNIILHSLVLNGEGQLSCHTRDQELALSPAVEELVSELHASYQSKAGKGYGYFSNEEERSTEFQDALKSVLAQEQDFVAFSKTASNLLADEVSKYDFAEEGVLLLVKYNWVASDYLLVVLLSNRDTVSVNENLEINASRHLDLGKVQLAASIDLTKWEREPDNNRYISFVKGRAGRKVADFFLDFLGCAQGLDAKVQNQGLMQAVDEYCTKTQMEPVEKQEYRESVYNYCSDQIEQGEDIDVKELSGQVPQLDEGSFYDFVAQDFELEEAFPGDKSAIRKLTKYVGSGGGLSISFDQKHLGERVMYDPDTDTLTIKGIPPNLRDQLKRSS